ncbi:MAG: S1 RNA-binding domain-containing protein, partial [Anaerotardibacter sp.]
LELPTNDGNYVYDGEIVGIKDFGAFVRLTPGKDGLLHISRMANGRVGKVEDILNVGDIVKVEVIEVSDNGKINLDRVDKPDVKSSGDDNADRKSNRKPRRPRH